MQTLFSARTPFLLTFSKWRQLAPPMYRHTSQVITQTGYHNCQIASIDIKLNVFDSTDDNPLKKFVSFV